MRVVIPTVGSTLTLTAPWSFWLWAEHRNEKFWRTLHGDPDQDSEFADYFDLQNYETYSFRTRSLKDAYWNFWSRVTAKKKTVLPPGTKLEIYRISIRDSKSTRPGEANSVAFKLLLWPLVAGYPTNKARTKVQSRFWAEIEDVNLIEGDWEESSLLVRT